MNTQINNYELDKNFKPLVSGEKPEITVEKKTQSFFSLFEVPMFYVIKKKEGEDVRISEKHLKKLRSEKEVDAEEIYKTLTKIPEKKQYRKNPLGTYIILAYAALMITGIVATVYTELSLPKTSFFLFPKP